MVVRAAASRSLDRLVLILSVDSLLEVTHP
jgi:hypothetical protein